MTMIRATSPLAVLLAAACAAAFGGPRAALPPSAYDLRAAFDLPGGDPDAWIAGELAAGCRPTSSSRWLTAGFSIAFTTSALSFAMTARGVFATAEDANDAPTADLLTERLQTHEKTAWMLRSLLADEGSASAKSA